MKIWLPADSAAIALGADSALVVLQAEAAKQGVDLQVTRTGSRGLHHLEPLLEFEADGQRLAIANVSAANADQVFTAMQRGEGQPVSDLLGGQHRVTFARCGAIAPTSVAEYVAAGGLAGLRNALAMSPDSVIAAVTESGLRGRGGAGFPAGIKWQTVAAAPADRKYIVCNADEGDSGTFADRMLIEGDPLQLIEGMAIAAWAVGAEQGFVYLRSEYPLAARTFADALAAAREAGLLGASVLGSGHRFDIELRIGAGSYVCGEETALLDSLEGKRGMVRAKPPLPAHHGLYGRPTIINNVLTLAAVTSVLADGAAAYQALGEGNSRGTCVVQLGGNIKNGGLYEVPFGQSLRNFLDQFGGGTLSGKPIGAVQVGGPLGAYLSPEQLDVPLTYEGLAAVGGMLGHGGIVVFDSSFDPLQQARFAFEFCAAESCGKCTPCRIGSTRGAELIADVQNGADRSEVLRDLLEVMTDGSLCAMGGLTPLPVRSALRIAGVEL